MWKLLFISVFSVSCLSAEKIIIIGAGAAGIATASKLLDHNISDFRILEAENRIGGRIHSFYLGNAFVDLGAQYVHGEKENVAFELAKNYLKHDSSFKEPSIYYTGSRKTDQNLIDEYFSLIEKTENTGPNTTLGDALISRFNDTIFERYKNNSEMLTYSRNFLRTAESLTLSLEGAFSWFNISSMSNYETCEGDQTVSWNGLGYKTILEMMLKNFPNRTGYNINKQISYEKTVSKISLREDTVKVRCQDGSEYNSEYVVFTPSLGVLKHDHKTLFEPELDEAKTNAIELLGFDGVMKVIFEFSTAWWGDKNHFILVWNEEEKKNLVNDIPFGPVKNGDHWLSWFTYFGTAPKNPNVLIGWILGPMVPDIERLTEEEIKNGTLYAMRKFLGKDFNITEPVKVIQSKWCTNPHFRGTYSYETIESMTHKILSGNDHDVLSQPIRGNDGIPRILFAGEVTNPKKFSTVHGAMETGYREADRLIEILKI